MPMSQLRFLSVCLAALFATSASFAAPEVFDDYRQAITKAKESGKLIAWILARSPDQAGDRVKQWVREELILNEKQVVIAHCKPVDSATVKLFSARFGQDTSKMPLLVVTDAEGKVIAAANGTEQEPYKKAIQEALAQAGISNTVTVKTNKEAEMLREAFGQTESGEVTMTNPRTWTFKNGALVDAALLRATGDKGTLIKKNGEKFDINFADLAPTDIAFLTQVLGRSPLLK